MKRIGLFLTLVAYIIITASAAFADENAIQALKGVRQVVITNGRSLSGIFSGNLQRLTITCEAADCSSIRVSKSLKDNLPPEEVVLPKGELVQVLWNARWNQKPVKTYLSQDNTWAGLIMPIVIGSILFAHAAPELFSQVFVTTAALGTAGLTLWTSLIPSKFFAARHIFKIEDAVESFDTSGALEPSTLYINATSRAFKNISKSLQRYKEEPSLYACRSAMTHFGL